jgi:hypothetical protein
MTADKPMSTVDSDNKQPNDGGQAPTNSDSNLMAALSYQKRL